MMKKQTIAQNLYRTLLMSLVMTGFFSNGMLFAEKKGKLEGEWRMAFQEFQFVTNNVTIVELPGDLTKLKIPEDRPIYLQRQIYPLDDGNQAVLLGEVYGRLRVDLNGQTIYIDPPNPIQGRPRVIVLPDSQFVPSANELVLVISPIERGPLGFTKGPLDHGRLQAMEWELFKHELVGLIHAGVFLVSGIFFIILFFRFKERKSFFPFGTFAILIALLSIFHNEFRYSVIPFSFTDRFAILILVFCFYFYNLFFHVFFERKQPAWAKLVWIIQFGISILCIFLPSFIFSILHSAILAINLVGLFYFIYSLYQIGLTRKTGLEAGAFIFAGLLFLTSDFAWERALMGFYLVNCLNVVMDLVMMHREVTERARRIQSVDRLKDRVFAYLANLMPGANKIVEEGAVLFGNAANQQKGIAAALIQNEVEQLQLELDDILELSRLEVISEPEALVNINFKDFISAVIPPGEITYTIQVHPDIELSTSLELVNSMVIRLIDYPGFKDFPQIDLIITSDLSGNVHFRFLLTSNDIKTTKKMLDLLTSISPDRGSLWIKWAIIRETIRILKGSMKTHILNRKYLRIDITLPAFLPKEQSAETWIEIRPIGSAFAIAEALPASAMTTVTSATTKAVPNPSRNPSLPPRTPPQLSGNMSIGDFVEWVKFKVTKK